MRTKSNITLQSEIPEKEDYFKLFETTGWNKGYQADTNELYRAIVEFQNKRIAISGIN